MSRAAEKSVRSVRRMSAFIFVYTIALILVCFAAAMFAVATYTVSRRRACLPQVAFFGTYIVELCSIFFSEWLAQNLPYSSEAYYQISDPVVRIATGAVILHSLWVMLLDVLDVDDRRVRLAPTVAFLCASTFVVVALPTGAVRQWAFYTLRQAYIAFGLIFSLVKYLTSTDDAYRRRLARHTHWYALLWVLLALIVAEDVLVILVVPEPTAAGAAALRYLSERNFAENLMMLVVAYHSIRGSLETLALRFREPPVAAAEGDLARHVADALPAYASAKGLSRREQEVLALVVEGLDNRSIAKRLVLSEGTIKTHVHNIMKKTGTASRDELKQDFWSS